MAHPHGDNLMVLSDSIVVTELTMVHPAGKNGPQKVRLVCTGAMKKGGRYKLHGFVHGFVPPQVGSWSGYLLCRQGCCRRACEVCCDRSRTYAACGRTVMPHGTAHPRGDILVVLSDAVVGTDVSIMH
jgi:hypothetical protein